ncbi:hypothetical protein [Kitasatospora sp. NPDC088783]|uniref:hypothetical protein n=1 Tax=Kitasatospora sp. NPDC088783 TaxID=3364077 RepID=UPI003801C989
MGNDLVTWIKTLVGTLFGAVLAVRAFQHWAKKEWGAFITFVVGGAVAALMIFQTDQAIAILKFLGDKIASVFQ